MQRRKFDELISHFNRKVSDMSIDQKYKMELLGMISAIGFAHEKELSTNLAEVGTDLISRQAAMDALKQQAETMSEWSNRYAEQRKGVLTAVNIIEDLPPAEPKKGKWGNIVDGTEYSWGTCDTCGARIPMAYKYYEYCPHCGADMRGEP